MLVGPWESYLQYPSQLGRVVTEFERDSYFQATDADPDEMVKELLLHYKSLKGRILDSEGKPLPLDRIAYGAKFTNELCSFVNSQNHSAEAINKASEIKTRCSE